MDIDQHRIDELLAHPSESLNVEIKRWIDPAAPEGIAKIVKAVQAIRNRNGGFLILGFDDKTLQPDRTNAPVDPRATFHVDTVQGLVSRIASERFEVGVGFASRDGNDYPVIVIPEGVTAPVSAQRDLQDAGGVFLIREGDVYFRTLGASGIPSTSRARPGDWRELVGICFDNREADFGRFLRRQLSAQAIDGLAVALAGIRSDAVLPSSLRNRAEAARREGEKRFFEAIEARGLTEEERALINVAAWQISLVLEPSKADAVADREFLNRFAGANPQYIGWPVWLDSRFFTDSSARPQMIAKAWQALIVSPKSWSPHLDFMRLDPRGQFYLWRALQDDLVPSRVQPGRAFDPILALLRVAEALAVGISVAHALGWEDTARLGFVFKWSKLTGRTLESWANPMVMILPGFVAHDDEVETFVDVPAGTPLSALAPYVEEATRELFLVFDGHSLPPQVVETWVRRLIERNLG
jgi:hypothetical protein